MVNIIEFLKEHDLILTVELCIDNWMQTPMWIAHIRSPFIDIYLHYEQTHMYILGKTPVEAIQLRIKEMLDKTVDIRKEDAKSSNYMYDPNFTVIKTIQFPDKFDLTGLNL